jgi:hypothetical protein
MTMLDHVPGMNRTPHSGLRLAAFLLAVLLGLQCVWLVAAELIRPDIDQLPTDVTTAAIAAKKRVAATVAASIGAVRGDLWAQSAYTYANLLWSENAQANSSAPEVLEHARKNLDRALHWGPPQSGGWLLLAGLAQEFRLAGVAPIEALKMSYYTGPSELPLVPLRLRIAVRADKFDDFEIRQFVSRDLRLLLAQDKKSVITEAYRAASPAGRSFMEQAIKDIDPSALTSLRTAARKQFLPD